MAFDESAVLLVAARLILHRGTTNSSSQHDEQNLERLRRDEGFGRGVRKKNEEKIFNIAPRLDRPFWF